MPTKRALTAAAIGVTRNLSGPWSLIGSVGTGLNRPVLTSYIALKRDR